MNRILKADAWGKKTILPIPVECCYVLTEREGLEPSDRLRGLLISKQVPCR